jgi:hypothetical protein
LGLNERIADRTDVRNPWFYADKAKRDYLTPEDVGAARARGADYVTVCVVVLRAIANGRVEDVGATAWVASEEK